LIADAAKKSAGSLVHTGQSLLLAPFFTGPPSGLGGISLVIHLAALMVDWGNLPSKVNVAQVAAMVYMARELDPSIVTTFLAAFNTNLNKLPIDTAKVSDFLTSVLMTDFSKQESLPILASCTYAQFMVAAHQLVHFAVLA
jgi:hypothetical protein